MGVFKRDGRVSLSLNLLPMLFEIITWFVKIYISILYLITCLKIWIPKSDPLMA